MIIQFGHVCENPTEWEQRFEQRDFNENNYQGKVSTPICSEKTTFPIILQTFIYDDFHKTRIP